LVPLPAVTGTVDPRGGVVFRTVPGGAGTTEGPSYAFELVGTFDAASRSYVGKVMAPGCSRLSSHEEPHAQVRGWSIDGGEIDGFHLTLKSDPGAEAHPEATDVLDLVIDDFACRERGLGYLSFRAIKRRSAAAEGVEKRILGEVVRHRFPGAAPMECLDGATVWDGAKGSFSAPDVDETVYLSNEGDCSSGCHCEQWGSMTLSLFQREKLVAFGVVAGSSWIDRVIDADGDGRDEIVLASGFTNGGYGSESAKLVRIGYEGLVVVEEFGGVVASSEFGPGGPPNFKKPGDSEVDERAIAHARRAGGKTTYWLEQIKGPCPEGGRP
jgi:hypothetical protein